MRATPWRKTGRRDGGSLECRLVIGCKDGDNVIGENKGVPMVSTVIVSLARH